MGQTIPMEQIISFMWSIFDGLEKHSTLILVIITAIYAYFTYRMTKIMHKQIAPDIKLRNIIIGSTFSEKWFLEKIKNDPQNIGYCKFKLYFKIFNQGGGGGSIEKPKIILKLSNINKEFVMLPRTKEVTIDKEESVVGIITYNNKIIDLGGSIYLRGGELQREEIEYSFNDTTKEIFDIIKVKDNAVQYFIKYHDTFGKEYLIKVEKVWPISELDIP